MRRSICFRFEAPAGSSACRLRAARRCGGVATAASCSTSMPPTGSPPVPVGATVDGEVTFGPPTTLFETRLYGAIGVSRQQYVPTPDGQRFLVVSVDEATTSTPLTLILNWSPHGQ